MTQYVRDSIEMKDVRPSSMSVCIWNFTDVCNLHCKHCYASAGYGSGNRQDLEEIKTILPQLRAAGFKIVILSGGEPLTRPDIFEVASAIKAAGMSTSLSTNGILINEGNIERIRDNFNYVGISIDGSPEIHDSFRGMEGASKMSLKALRLCMENGIEAGLRFTLSALTHQSLPYIFSLVKSEGIPKLYISHLVSSGRAGDITPLDLKTYRKSVDFIIGQVFEFYEKGIPVKVVSGNNDSEAVILLSSFKDKYRKSYDNLYERLRTWGGNQAGVRLVNINNSADVKPDPFFLYSMGNLRSSSFTKLWNSEGLLSELRRKPRKLKGRCGNCTYLDLCNGNSRARAFAVTGDYFAEDPACII